MSPLVGRVAREGGRCEFRCPLEERGENRRIHFDGGEILLRSIEISHGEGGGWRSLISKDEGAGIRNVVLPKARRDCRRVFRAIRKRLESRATFLNSIMHPRILAVFRVSFSTSFSSLQLGREVRRGISLGLLVSSLRRNSRGPRGGILDTRNSGDVECCIQNGDVSLNVFLSFVLGYQICADEFFSHDDFHDNCCAIQQFRNADFEREIFFHDGKCKIAPSPYFHLISFDNRGPWNSFMKRAKV